MNNYFIRIYIQEIQTQCGYAIAACQAADQALRHCRVAANSDERKFAMGEVFRNLHSVLTHASNVSKMFWPSSVRQQMHGETDEEYLQRLKNVPKEFDRATRGAVLQELFEVEDESPLSSKSLRNHLEHYDERMDEWRAESVSQSFSSGGIAPIAAVSVFGATNSFRHFDPETRLFHFRGGEFSIQAQLTEVCKISDRSLHLQKDGWSL